MKIGQTTRIDARLEPLEVAAKVAINDPALIGAKVFIDAAPVNQPDCS